MKLRYLFYVFAACLSIAGCNDEFGIGDNNVNTEDISNQDTIITPSYGTINIIIPQREASVVNVDGYTASSFKCRVDLTKEPPVGGGAFLMIG